MRINIDSEFFSDERVTVLSQQLNESHFTVRGRLISVWHKAYLRKSSVLTEKEIRFAGGHSDLAKLMADCDLATEVEGGFFLKGVEERIEWLKKKEESGRKGGIKSAEMREAKRKQIQANASTPQAEVNQKQAKASKSNPHSHSHSHSLVINSPNGERATDVAAPSLSNEFLNIWNAVSGPLPKVKGLNDTRKSKIKARLKEQPELSYWEAAIRRMAASSFCVEGKWATFDWLIKNDTNHIKVSEGNYDDKHGKQDQRQAATSCLCNGRGVLVSESGRYKCSLCNAGSVVLNDYEYAPASVVDELRNQQSLN